MKINIIIHNRNKTSVLKKKTRTRTPAMTTCDNDITKLSQDIASDTLETIPDKNDT